MSRPLPLATALRLQAEQRVAVSEALQDAPHQVLSHAEEVHLPPAAFHGQQSRSEISASCPAAQKCLSLQERAPGRIGASHAAGHS